MAQREVHGVVRPERRSESADLSRRVRFLANPGDDLFDEVAVVLVVASDALRWVLLRGVEALVVHAVDADDLEPSGFHEIADRPDETEILVLIEAPLRGGKPDHRAAGVPEPEDLHSAAQDGRIPLRVLAVHRRCPPGGVRRVFPALRSVGY